MANASQCIRRIIRSLITYLINLQNDKASFSKHNEETVAQAVANRTKNVNRDASLLCEQYGQCMGVDGMRGVDGVRGCR